MKYSPRTLRRAMGLFGAMFLPSVLLANLTATPTIAALGSLDLDTGAVVDYPSDNFDLKWNSTLHTSYATSGYLVQGMTGQAAFNALTQTDLAGFPYASNFSVGVPPLAVGTILAFHTKQGNYAKVLVTALTPASGSGSISLQFTTYGVGGGGNSVQPVVTSVQNNFGLIPQGLPNSGVAPGSLFFVQGTNLASDTTPLQSSGAPGLQTELNGVSVEVTVVNRKVKCYLYYLSPTQIDAVLPSNIPTGAATLTVTNNGVSSAGTQIEVALSNFGILAYNGTLAAAYDANNALLTPFNSANPNQAIVLWGAGVGADLSNDDYLYPQQQNDLKGAYLQAFVGGVSAPIQYAGRSQYPGVDQIVLTIPANVPPGCYVSLVVVSNETPSNSTTIPIAASGKTCSDSNSAVTPQQGAGLSAQGAVNIGVLGLARIVGQGNFAYATFNRVTGYGSTLGSGSVSLGSCVVTNSLQAASATSSPLNAGSTLSLTSPTGGSATLTQNALANQPAGTYAALLAYSAIPTRGGAFTFRGNGGADVGSFNAKVNFPADITWTNEATLGFIFRSQGVMITWIGGGSDGFVSISGSVVAAIGDVSNATVTFTCNAPIHAGSFTVPPSVLLALPAGSGTLSVNVISNPQTFTAGGLDFGSTLASVSYSRSVVFGFGQQ